MKIAITLCMLAWFGLALAAGLPSLAKSPAHYPLFALAIITMTAAAFCWRSILGPDHKAKRLTPVRFSINALIASVVMTVALGAVLDLVGWSQSQ